MASYVRLKRFNAKKKHLDELNTSDSRKQKKEMSTFKIRNGRINTAGFYEPTGRHPINCKG